MTAPTPGAVVSRLRRERGWTQKQLAENSDVSINTIASLETDRSPGAPETLDKLAAVFDIDTGLLCAPTLIREVDWLIWRLRNIAESAALCSKVSESDYSDFVTNAREISEFLATLAEARGRIARFVHVIHENPLPTPADLNDSLIEGITELIDEYQKLFCTVEDPDSRNAARVRHESGKLHHVLGLIARTKMHAAGPGSPSRFKWEETAATQFRRARANFEAEIAEGDAPIRSRSDELARRLKVQETELERLLVWAPKLKPAILTDCMDALNSIQEDYLLVSDVDLRESGEANCKFGTAKLLFCLSRSADPEEPPTIAQRLKWLRECEALCREVITTKGRLNAEDGVFWAKGLLAKATLERVRNGQDDTATKRALEENYSDALRPQDRIGRRTLRSACILIWLYDDLRTEPLLKGEKWSRDLLHLV